jgi:arylsulfatase A-like enzyme
MKKPNVLWIFSDQHRAHAMSCAGDTNIETPNLDRIAREGIRFTNAYSNCPLCSPFRASLYSGKYNHHHGVRSLDIPFLRPQESIQEHLQEQGWHTSHMGKWHLAGGAAPDPYVSEYYRPGWDDWRGWENMNVPFDSVYIDAKARNKRIPLGVFQTDGITDYTVEWLSNYNGEKPWFHVMSIEAPHPPNLAPEKYMRLYRDRDLELRPNFNRAAPKSDLYLEKLRGYYAQIKNLDDNIGRVLATLEKRNWLENTIICYFSDHGDFQGSHRRTGKWRPEEESSNIPLIIQWPEAIPRGQVTDALISAVDIMPTLCGLLALPIPDSCDGEDFSGLLQGKQQKGANEILLQYWSTFFSENPNHQAYRAIRTEDYLYAVFPETGERVLYDMQSDPYQMKNLADNPEHIDLKKKMHNKLVAKMKQEGDHDFLKYIPELKPEVIITLDEER